MNIPLEVQVQLYKEVMEAEIPFVKCSICHNDWPQEKCIPVENGEWVCSFCKEICL